MHTQNEKIYFISDIEMGRGDITDDFSDDEAVKEFLESIQASEPDQKITLVLNGDIFDFLKMPYQNEYPRYITERVSLWKLSEAMKAHPKVFEGMKEFLKNDHHHIHFVIGNHDPDMVWPAVQEKIQDTLGSKKRITFDYWFQKSDLHAEHGNLEDPFFAINPKKPFVKYKGLTILNLPWGAHACFSHLINLKKKFPKEESYFPKPLAMKKNKEFEKESRKTTWRLATKSLLIDPILHFTDPTYRVPYGKFLKHILHFGFEFIDDEKLMEGWVQRLIKTHPKNNTFIFGHAHVPTDTEKEGKRVIITDTWRNEYDLRNGGAKKEKTYAKVEYKDGKIADAGLQIFPSGCGAVG